MIYRLLLLFAIVLSQDASRYRVVRFPVGASRSKEQQTYLAVSKDGLRFSARKEELDHTTIP